MRLLSVILMSLFAVMFVDTCFAGRRNRGEFDEHEVARREREGKRRIAVQAEEEAARELGVRARLEAEERERREAARVEEREAVARVVEVKMVDVRPVIDAEAERRNVLLRQRAFDERLSRYRQEIGDLSANRELRPVSMGCPAGFWMASALAILMWWLMQPVGESGAK